MKKFWRSWKWVVPALVGIIIFGFFLRVFHLTILPVFADEAIYIRWSQIMASEPTLRFLPLSDGKQPLFMWILMFFVKRLSDPLFAGRLLSAATGIASMIGIFLLTYRVFKSKLSATIAPVLWALSPLSLFFDRMALVDGMLTCFGIWSLYFSILIAETLRLDLAMIGGFILGFASLTKSTALFYAALIPVAAILLKKPKNIIKFLSLTIVTYLIALGMYNIQRLGPNFALLSTRTADYVFPLSRLLIYPTDPFRYNFPTAFIWLFAMGPAGLLILSIFGIWTNFKRTFKYILILAIWFLAPLIYVSEFSKSFTLRYILFLVPPLYVFAAGAFANFSGKWKYLVLIAFAAFLIQSTAFDWFLLTNPQKANFPQRDRMGYFQEWTSGIGIKESADYIRQVREQNPNKKIVVGTEGYFGTLPDGFMMYVQDIPNIVVVGTGLAIKAVPQQLLESKLSGNLTYFIVNKSRLLVDPSELNLKLISAYPKEPRIPGTTEYAYFGPQDYLYFFEVK